MSFNTIGLPVDIPWKRICVTDDMIDKPICDGQYPSPFKSSIAIFRFDPEMDEQPIEGYRIAYIKVSCSITPFKIDETGPLQIDLPGAVVNESLNTQPCHGALLQFSIGPKSGDPAPKDYPYFLDFEPKKREEYEVVTETGGVSSGSGTQVTLGKSTTNTNSTERYDVLNGVQASVSVLGIGASGGATGKWGSQSESGSARTESQTSDSSTDRRETKSHTSAFTNIYSLFQAFHIGTNRALFFIEPRPFVVTSQREDQTFIKGIRKLEGIQEVFFVVAYKYAGEGDDFCVNVKLETAHIFTNRLPPQSKIVDETLVFPTNLKTGTVAPKDGRYYNFYRAPEGYEIVEDETIIKGDESLKTIFIKDGIDFTCFVKQGETQTVSLTVTLKQKIGDQVAGAMYLVSRDLCCCEDSVKGGCPDTYTPYYKNLTQNFSNVKVLNDASKIEPGNDASALSSVLTHEIITSIESPRRTPCGDLPPDLTDVVTSTLTNTLTASGGPTQKLITQSVTESLAIPPEKRDILEDTLGSSISVLELLRMDSYELSIQLGMSRREIQEMKMQMIAMLKPTTGKPITRPILRKVANVSFLSSYPDPLNPKKLSSITDPSSMQILQIQDQPNIVEVEFNGTPDSGTVTTSSFYMTKGSTILIGTIEIVTSRRYRLVFSTPLDAFGLYSLTLLGTGSSAIKFNGLKLDGDPIGMPSGDNIEGGDFTAAIRVNAPIATPAIPTMPDTLIKVVGIRVLSSQPTPSAPRIISEILNPGLTQVLDFADVPDTIEVDFNVPPDGGTLTTSTFTISTDAGSVAATLTSVTPTRARLKMNSAPLAGTVYKVTLDGTTGSAIKYLSKKLDGDPTQIPSGNNSESGDFTTSFKVGAAIPDVPTPDILLKVIGARVSSSSPNPSVPRVLQEITNLGSVPSINATEIVDVIDLDFNVAPDGGTVTTASFTLVGPSGAVSGTVTSISSTKYRFKATTPLSSSGIYHIKLSGNVELTAKYSGRKLDGEPIALPSGDGIPGGDFGFNFYLSV